jgi:hypothetical protein
MILRRAARNETKRAERARSSLGSRCAASASELDGEWEWGAYHVTVFRIDDFDRSDELVRRIGIDID